MLRPLALALVVAFLSAGCLGIGGDGKTPTAGAEARQGPVEAPWWRIGESWTIRFQTPEHGTRTVTMVNFANDSWDPAHFWLGVQDRREALDHVFFDNNPFLGRIHHVILAPHEKGMHSQMYQWPLEDGSTWTSPLLLGKEDLVVVASQRADGTFFISGEARKDGSTFAYDYDPATRWFREITITEPTGKVALKASVTDHKESGAKGTYYFLRGRDYLDATGGKTGQSEPFKVKDEGATSIAFLLDVQTQGPSSLEFIAPTGEVWHREALPLGGASDKVVEVPKTPPPGQWELRYVGDVKGEILVRGIIEYKGTL